MARRPLRLFAVCTLCSTCIACGGGAGTAVAPVAPVEPQAPRVVPPSTPKPTPRPTTVPTTVPKPAPSPTPAVSPDAPCAGYRWPIKIAADPQAAPLAGAAAVVTTIDHLLAIVPPARRLDGRAAPVETAVYRLNGVTVQSMRHAVDGDYHLVLVDAQNRTLIAESPDPACVRASMLFDRIRAVRPAVAGARAGDRVSLEGAGFFDYEPNFATGQAPNGIELHPITAICFGTGCTPK